MAYSAIIIDNFYDNPDEVREFALAQDFNVDGNYPGHRTQSFLTPSVQEWIAKACTKLQGQVTSGANCIAQKATIAALEAEVSQITYMIDEFKQRKKLIIDLLSEIDGLNLNDPDGAFYVFPDVSEFFGKTIEGFKIENSSDFAMFLLEKAHVATVTGEAFGCPDNIRISYAASKENIIEAVKRIKNVLS